ncbi:hypothetical protein [Rhodocaloribacter sp.]
MDTPRMRPRFEIVSARPPADVLARLRDQLEHTDCPCTGQIAGKHVHLRVDERDRRLWSPHLDVEVEPYDGGALLRGHFGPHPDVWTFFVALYAVLAFAVMVGLLFGASQWMLGTPPVALWAVPAALVLAAVIYGLALLGQRLSQDHMRRLRSFVEKAGGVNP